jgi:hypothetical protein
MQAWCYAWGYHRFVYRDALWSHPDVANEVMLLWYLQL